MPLLIEKHPGYMYLRDFFPTNNYHLGNIGIVRPNKVDSGEIIIPLWVVTNTNDRQGEILFT